MSTRIDAVDFARAISLTPVGITQVAMIVRRTERPARSKARRANLRRRRLSAPRRRSISNAANQKWPNDPAITPVRLRGKASQDYQRTRQKQPWHERKMLPSGLFARGDPDVVDDTRQRQRIVTVLR